MTLDILICTIDSGMSSIDRVLMPPMPDVHYVVSVQHTRPLAEAPAEWGRALDALRQRSDVTLTTIEGRGLSRNRNNALQHATADVIVVADDDCRYTAESVRRICRAYAQRPDADAICFEATGYDGTPLKRYPAQPLSYAEACRQGYYAASVELTFRRERFEACGLRFDERFGLGAAYPASEEEVLLVAAERAGLNLRFEPLAIVATDAVTTGARFLGDARLQVTKGVVFALRYGRPSALWRTLKEGAHHLLHSGANPLPIWKNMLCGIWTSL